MIRTVGTFVLGITAIVSIANVYAMIWRFEAGGSYFEAGLDSLMFLLFSDLDERFTWPESVTTTPRAYGKLAELDKEDGSDLAKKKRALIVKLAVVC